MTIVVGAGAGAEARGRAGELVATLRLAGPIVVANLGQIAIHTTDVLLMGRLGPDSLAAGALGANVLFGVFMFPFGTLSAVAAIAGQALGRGRPAEANAALRAGLWAAALLSPPAWLAIWLAPAALGWLGIDPRIVAMAWEYLQTFMWCLLPAFGFAALRAFIAAHERPAAGTVITLLGVAANALLVYALMFGAGGLPALGLWGAGLAGTLVNALMFLALAGFVAADPGFRRLRPFAGLARFDRRGLAELLRVGAPVGVALTLEVGVFVGASFAMGTIAPAVLAAHQIAIQCASITFMVPMGIAQAATVRVALAAGAGDRIAAARAGWTALALGVAFMAAMAGVLWRWPDELAGLFIDTADGAGAEVAALAAAFLLVAAAFQIADATQAVAAGALRGLKDTRVPMAVCAVGYWAVGAPLALGLAFGAGWGGMGVWVGLALGLAVVAVALVWRWRALSAV